MGTISSLFVHKVVNAAVADEPGGAQKRQSLLASVGLEAEAPVDPKHMISDTLYYDFCERVVRADNDGTSLSIRVGSSMKCDEYGAFGLAWKSAVNLRGSYHRAERYGLVLTSVSTYEVRQENNKHYMLLHRDGKRRLGMRISNEQTIVAIVQISREVCPRDFTPDAIHFRHSSPGDVAAHESFFGCPVIYNSDRDAVEVSEESLLIPNKLGDASISSFFDSHLEKELAEMEDHTSLAKRMRIQISQLLSEGLPKIGEVAPRLEMSSRTLQRRLAEQGLSFQNLVDESRRELSKRLLRSTEYSLAEIAFLTGFSEQSSFTRAFKRWAGQTPRSYRLAGQ